MKFSLKKMLKCFKILLRTSTIPKKDWILVFITIFLTLGRYPDIILKKNWTGTKKHFLSDFLPHPVTIKDSSGLLFMARPKFEDLARFLFSETLAKWEPRSMIKLDDSEVMIDVGANTGFYTLYLAKKYRNSKILSIEADPETSSLLDRNCKLNDLANVTIYNLAASDKEGELTLYQSGSHSGIHSIFQPKSNSPDLTSVKVKSTTLDNLLDGKFDKIAWIKIDVEGAELSVLRGCEKTLNIVKKIFVEVHEHILKQNNETSHQIVQLLENSGFKITLFPEYWNQTTSPNQDLKSDYILAEK